MIIRKCVLLSIALWLAAAPASHSQTPAPAPEKALVVHVFDGDTILISSRGRKLKVRLLGIDAPEKEGPYTKAEPLGAEAGRRAARLVLRKKVTLVYGGDTLTDKYGRLLAHVVLPDGRTLNEIMLEEGLAEAFHKFNYSRKKLYHRLEAESKAACRGIWKLRKVCADSKL